MMEALLNHLNRIKNWFTVPVESNRKRRATEDPDPFHCFMDSKCRRLEPARLKSSFKSGALFDENIFAFPTSSSYHRKSTLPLTSDHNINTRRKSPTTIGSIILDDDDDDVIEVPCSNNEHGSLNRKMNRFTSTPRENQRRNASEDDVCFVKEYKTPPMSRSKSGSSKLSFNVSDVLNSLSLSNGIPNSGHVRSNGVNNLSNGTKTKILNPSKRHHEDSGSGRITSPPFKGCSILDMNYRLDEKKQYKKLLDDAASPSVYHTPPSRLHLSRSNGSTGSRGQKILALTKEPEQENTGKFLLKVINDFDKEPIVVTDTDSDVEIFATPPSPKPDIKVPPVNTLKPIIEATEATKKVWLSKLVKNHRDYIQQKRNEIDDYEKQHKALHDINSKILIGTLTNQVDKCLAIRDEVIPLEEEEEEIPLPELTSKHEQIVRKAFSGNPSEVLVKKFKMNLTRRDILTLRGTNWLNDEVINFYMNLITERGEQGRFLKAYTMNTFFYPKLTKEGPESLKRWTRRVDIFSYELICVPIHLSVHWCMAIIDFRNSSIKYYDSMHGNNVDCLTSLREYLEFEHLDKKKKPLDTSGFKLEIVKDIPQQMNGSDCGVFSCMFAEFLSRNSRITFTQDHMPYFRKKMVVEIITGELMIQ